MRWVMLSGATALLLACGGKTGSETAVDGGIGALPEGGRVTDATAVESGRPGGDGSGAGDGSSADATNAPDTSAGCKPLPGCDSGTQCPSTHDDCNTCSCEQGVWQCTGNACEDSGSTNVNCASTIVNGSACNQAVDHDCDLVGGEAPGPQCEDWVCHCTDAQIWSCHEADCTPVDAGDPPLQDCPQTQPESSSSCPVDGVLCSYGVCAAAPDESSTSCFCFGGAWECEVLVACGNDG